MKKSHPRRKRHSKTQWLLNTCLLAAFLVASTCCGGGDDDGDKPGSGSSGTGSETSTTTAWLSRLEMPQTKAAGTQFIVHTTTYGGREVMTYALEYDLTAHHSRWVAFRFDATTRARNVSRSSEPFQDDPDLASAYHIGSGGFGSGYDRGHICASADRLYSSEANEQTFYMSNMSPQISSFNQGYWVTLEGIVQKLGRNASFADTLYVVKGGTVESGNVIGYRERNNGTRVAIPKYYFMALLKVKNGAYKSIGFWMEHKDWGYTYQKQAPESEFADRAVSIEELERRTGIDFFHNLPDVVEKVVEQQCSPTEWNIQ